MKTVFLITLIFASSPSFADGVGNPYTNTTTSFNQFMEDQSRAMEIQQIQSDIADINRDTTLNTPYYEQPAFSDYTQPCIYAPCD